MLKTLIKSYLPLPILDRAVGRKHRIFALGPPKSGTTSIAGIFSGHCRVDHEPHRPETVHGMFNHFNGLASDEDLQEKYRARDRQLLLDVESNCFLAYRPDLLRSTFPNAQFIVTVRHPLQWLDSILDNNINFPRDKTPTMRKWHSVLFHTNNTSRSSHCNFLIEKGLYPVDCYLAYWARTYDRCIRSLSGAQRLLIGTNRISTSTEDIGNFVGMDLTKADTNTSHKNKTTAKHGILKQLDASYVKDSLQEYCQPVISEFGLTELWD